MPHLAISHAFYDTLLTSLVCNAESPPKSRISAKMLPFFDYFHTVSEDEIDAQRHVHNLRYLQWTLWAAGSHWRTAGADKGPDGDQTLGWVVREHEVTYRAAARAGDQIVVRTWVHDVQRFASRRKYVVCRPADRTVLTRVLTRWVYVDLARHKVVSIPERLRALIPVPKSAPPMPWE